MKPGKKIAELRKFKKIKQIDLAKSVGIPQSHLSDIERGVKGISFTMASKICLELGVNTNYLTEDSALEKTKESKDDVNTESFTGSDVLDTVLINNPELFEAFHTLYDFNTFLGEMNHLQAFLFENPTDKLIDKINNSQGANSEDVLKNNEILFKIIIEFSKLAKPFLNTRRSHHHRVTIKDLENKMEKL